MKPFLAFLITTFDLVFTNNRGVNKDFLNSVTLNAKIQYTNAHHLMKNCFLRTNVVNKNLKCPFFDL